MKKITVIVQPAKFEAIKKKLVDMGINGITISNCEGYGFQKRKNDVFEGKEIAVEFMPRVKIEIIIEIARTGRIGDGKIFISEVSDAIRIRTGERGEFAV